MSWIVLLLKWSPSAVKQAFFQYPSSNLASVMRVMNSAVDLLKKKTLSSEEMLPFKERKWLWSFLCGRNLLQTHSVPVFTRASSPFINSAVSGAQACVGGPGQKAEIKNLNTLTTHDLHSWNMTFHFGVLAIYLLRSFTQEGEKLPFLTYLCSDDKIKRNDFRCITDKWVSVRDKETDGCTDKATLRRSAGSLWGDNLPAGPVPAAAELLSTAWRGQCLSSHRSTPHCWNLSRGAKERKKKKDLFHNYFQWCILNPQSSLHINMEY